MLEELIKKNSTEAYTSSGGMRIKEISIRPWETPDAKIILEIWTDDWKGDPHEIWELTCIHLGKTVGIPLAVFGESSIRLYDDHPLLWDQKIYFSITGGTGISVVINTMIGNRYATYRDVDLQVMFVLFFMVIDVDQKPQVVD